MTLVNTPPEPKDTLDIITEDTKICYFQGFTDGKFFNEGDETPITEINMNYFILTKEVKEEILRAIGEAKSEGVEPSIILLPQSKIKRKVRNFSYPILFLGLKVYVVPFLRKIMVFESE